MAHADKLRAWGRRRCSHRPDAALGASIIADVLRLEALETLDRHVLNQGESLLLGLLILVALARHTHAHAYGHVADTGAPNELVQLRVHTHVLGGHGPHRKLPDLPDRPGRALLELDLLEQLVQVDGGIACHRLLVLAPALLRLRVHHGAEQYGSPYCVPDAPRCLSR